MIKKYKLAINSVFMGLYLRSLTLFFLLIANTWALSVMSPYYEALIKYNQAIKDNSEAQIQPLLSQLLTYSLYAGEADKVRIWVKKIVDAAHKKGIPSYENWREILKILTPGEQIKNFSSIYDRVSRSYELGQNLELEVVNLLLRNYIPVNILLNSLNNNGKTLLDILISLMFGEIKYTISSTEYRESLLRATLRFGGFFKVFLEHLDSPVCTESSYALGIWAGTSENFWFVADSYVINGLGMLKNAL
ncbi:MAG TPA: hypothetical protein VHA52_00105, partial [Candidatus Babeliaceae bacterium]|nr:hypothetical protein [Candidatus Babeliaceae bacterium]